MSRQDYLTQLKQLLKGNYKKLGIHPHFKLLDFELHNIRKNSIPDDFNACIQSCIAECNCAAAIRDTLFSFLKEQENQPEIKTALNLAQAWLYQAQASHLIIVLQHDDSLQQCIAMLNHIYCVQRRMDDNTLNDCDWMRSLKTLLESFTLHYQGKDIIEDVWKNLVTAFFSKSINDIQLAQGDEKLRIAEVREKIQARISTLLHGMPDTLGLHYFLSKKIRETQIKLLGGVDPLVFQIEYAGGQRMILRLYQNPLSDDNLAAQATLREHYPDVVSQVFYMSNVVSEIYCYAEFSEFFAYGTLADYIKNLHARKKEGCFTDVEQRIFFKHFKQILGLLTELHAHHVYFPDSKPSNFLFNRDPLAEEGSHLMISDLKSAALLTGNKKTTYNVAYTADYAAPEVLRMNQEDGDEVNPYAQDIYALAMTFLEYLIGTTAPLSIKDYQPRDNFEKIMYDLLSQMLHTHPLLRLEFAHFINKKIKTLESELFVTSQEEIAMQCFGGRLFAQQKTIPRNISASPDITITAAATHSPGDKS